MPIIDIDSMKVKEELVIMSDDIKKDLLMMGFDFKEVDKVVTENEWCGRSGKLTLKGKDYEYCHGNTRKHTLIRMF